MEVFEGRPESCEGRLEKECAVYDLLDRLGIPFLRADHEAVMTMEGCEAADRVLGVEMCKNLFLCNAQKTSFYLLLMPGDKKFKTKDLSKQIQSARLSFAGAEYMEKYLNIEPGAVSILGLMYDREKRVRLLIDRETLEAEYLGCHPCVNTSSLKIKMSDILEKFLPWTGHAYTAVDLPRE
ncbi:MAG TPA: prolyl-tRNA synthetase associated domain-containing protein [Candidatus Scatomonas pullistercoris]|uniref:Prolyl-tRNA synthetase associated domain-containing protein n=1 Tax=Candidatus Scatomonas pullistercoris TaxID=2840920 RepID=A0A9D1P3E1_9FIRM|nr:prolyl-tRNA synthetase associated domain-containing protein [Candidatus Scatomonas pullistercoris]